MTPPTGTQEPRTEVGIQIGRLEAIADELVKQGKPLAAAAIIEAAWTLRALQEATARKEGWIPATEGLPEKGQRIVCEYKTGEVWAGKYFGVKQSFERWMPLPAYSPPDARESPSAGQEDRVKTDLAPLALRQAFAFGLEIRHKKGCNWASPASNFQKNKHCECGRDELWKLLNDVAFSAYPVPECPAALSPQTGSAG